MSDALRPTSLFNAATPATAASSVKGTLPNPPPEVSQLPAGTTLRGVVLEHDGKGHLLVRTDLGVLAVATKAHLPPGSEVVLQIRSSGAQLHVLLMHSDAPTAGSPQRGALPLSGPAGGAPPPDQLTLGQTVRAILQTSAALPTATGSVSLATGTGLDPATAATVARLAPGSQFLLRILAVDIPAGSLPGTAQAIAPGASPGTATPGQGPTTAPQVPGQIAAPAAAGAVGTPIGTPVGNTVGTPAASQVAPQTGLPGTIQPGAIPASAPGAAVAQSPPGSVPPAGSLGQTPSPGVVTPAPGITAGTLTTGPGGITAQVAIGAPAIAVAGAPLSTSISTPVAVPPSVGAAYGAAAQTALQPGGTPGLAGPPGPGIAPPGSQNIAVPGAGAPAGPSPSPTANSTTSPNASPTVTQITGVVTATTNSGHPVLQTSIGTLTLEMQAAMPVGSRVIFELSPGAIPREMANLPASLARAWPDIQEVIRVLHEAAPAGGPPVPGATEILQPGSRLASGLIFFLAALNGGDMGRWLGGQAIQALKNAGRGALLTRLGQDFGQLSRHVESGGTDWRLFLIPLHDGSQVQQIRFFERHGSHGYGNGNGQQDDESTRFILEIELSRTGDMQIDGLVRGKRFDLMLRTHRPLPDKMRHDITEIFSEANEAAGFSGNIGFQASRDWRFMPIDGGGSAATGSGLVI